MLFRYVILAGLITVCAGRPAAAQAVQLVPVDFSRVELAGSVGWQGVRRPSFENWNDRYDTGTAAATAGFFWTRHLKTEVTVSTSGEGSMFESVTLPPVPGRPPTFRYLEHYYQETAVSPAVSYQFLENRWVHPFLTAGVDFVRERHEVFDIQQNLRTSESTHFADAFVGAGAKFFMTERSFIRSDIKYAFRDQETDRTTWTVGVGFEF